MSYGISSIPHDLDASSAQRGQAAQVQRTLDVRRHTFLTQAVERHGERYEYSEFIYRNAGTKGKILCPLHGPFWQTPSNHLKGTKCPACVRAHRRAESFKGKCQRLGVDYWRALKRREAGMPEEKIFEEMYVRGSKETIPITVHGITYPNIEEAIRVLSPPATSTTIKRWIAKGLSPEQAFREVPAPGYAQGIIYLVTHRESGKQYVGLTIQPLPQRWKNHIEQAWAGHIKGADSLHAALRLHRPDAFDVRQIDQGTTKKDLEQKERHWIKTYDTLIPDGYNMSPGGVSGGSLRKPTIIDGLRFDSVKEAVAYVARTRHISVQAAAKRFQAGRIDVKTPAKRGKSLVKTKIYKTWSYVVHVATNPKSQGYIAGLSLHPSWHDFTMFSQDVGDPPNPDMAFVRLNKAKGFSPGNCAWLSKADAARMAAKSGPLQEQPRMPNVQQLSLWES